MHDAPVVCVRFDPLSSRVIASASADGQVIVSTSYYEELDGKAEAAGPFGKVNSQEILFRFKCSEWVNTISFSPSGKWIAFATHDSTMHFVPITEENVVNSSKPKDG